MAQLFGKAKSTNNKHIKSIFAEEELQEDLYMHKFGISEFQQKAFNYYNHNVFQMILYNSLKITKSWYCRMKKTHLFSSDYFYSLIRENASHFVILSLEIILLICSGLNKKREIFV